MTDNVYLKIAQDKGLIDQDDYQGWRLTAKGERFLETIYADGLNLPYFQACLVLENRLTRTREWDISTWFEACTNEHPKRIRISAVGDIKFTCWVSVSQVLQGQYDAAAIIAGQYEAALRQAVGNAE